MPRQPDPKATLKRTFTALCRSYGSEAPPVIDRVPMILELYDRLEATSTQDTLERLEARLKAAESTLAAQETAIRRLEELQTPGGARMVIPRRQG